MACGVQYTSLAYGRWFQEAGVVPSMGSASDAYDNAIAEAFFATLEMELLMRHRFIDRGTARRALFDYIEGYTTRTVLTPPWSTAHRQSLRGGGRS